MIQSLTPKMKSQSLTAYRPLGSKDPSSPMPTRQPAADGGRERRRTPTASIRCDFIVNLDPFMRREVGRGGGAATARADDRAPSLLPRRRPSALTVHLIRRQTEGDDRSRGSISNDDVGAVTDRGEDGGGPTVIGAATGNGGRLITREDDPSIRTYPLRIVDQLRLCERKAKDGGGGIAATTVVGFECIHCRRTSSPGGTTRQQRQERFRRFPRTPQEVSTELSSFRTHLSACRGVPRDLRSYLSWMERRWWPSQRLQRTAPAIAVHIMRRLNARPLDGDRNAAPPSENAEAGREHEIKKRARELVELERAKLERAKRIVAKRRRSVLEDVGSLA
jgi:hypothetical protein